MKNKNVVRVSESSITYHPDFKIQAVRQNVLESKPPYLIFLDAGLDPGLIGHDNPKRCLRRWRAIFEKRGEEGLKEDLRGKNSTGRPLERELTIEEKLRRAEARIKYLESENDLLKKLELVERGVNCKASQKFEIIHRLLSSEDNEFNLRYLCEVACVSRSGYYNWINTASDRVQREQQDYEQHLLIREIFVKKNKKSGWRVIRMELDRMEVKMNHKKIRRLMRKYSLITQVRRQNPYKRLAKATKEHLALPNVLDRQFSQDKPYRAFGTDITYLYGGNGQRSYLSILRDMATGEIAAYHWSTSLCMDLSLALVNKAVDYLGEDTFKGALIHSDQGFHYTHPFYIRSLAKLGIVQSMSRKGNCIDNAPTESFFGHLKDELDLSSCYTADQIRDAIAAYIDHYNNRRYQWARKKMAPVEYRDLLLAA
jgi:Transposase and inactivated derivatives